VDCISKYISQFGGRSCPTCRAPFARPSPFIALPHMQLSLANIERDAVGEEPAIIRRNLVDTNKLDELKHENQLLQDQQKLFRDNLNAADQDL
jgi:hypothetical protein